MCYVGMLHEPLGERAAAAVGVELEHEQVRERLAVVVAGLTGRHGPVAVDHQDLVRRLP